LQISPFASGVPKGYEPCIIKDVLLKQNCHIMDGSSIKYQEHHDDDDDDDDGD